jgi:hypothetical protein
VPNETLELAKALLARASVTPDDAGCPRRVIEPLAVDHRLACKDLLRAG